MSSVGFDTRHIRRRRQFAASLAATARRSTVALWRLCAFCLVHRLECRGLVLLFRRSLHRTVFSTFRRSKANFFRPPLALVWTSRRGGHPWRPVDRLAQHLIADFLCLSPAPDFDLDPFPFSDPDSPVFPSAVLSSPAFSPVSPLPFSWAAFPPSSAASLGTRRAPPGAVIVLSTAFFPSAGAVAAVFALGVRLVLAVCRRFPLLLFRLVRGGFARGGIAILRASFFLGRRTWRSSNRPIPASPVCSGRFELLLTCLPSRCRSWSSPFLQCLATPPLCFWSALSLSSFRCCFLLPT